MENTTPAASETPEPPETPKPGPEPLRPDLSAQVLYLERELAAAQSTAGKYYGTVQTLLTKVNETAKDNAELEKKVAELSETNGLLNEVNDRLTEKVTYPQVAALIEEIESAKMDVLVIEEMEEAADASEPAELTE